MTTKLRKIWIIGLLLTGLSFNAQAQERRSEEKYIEEYQAFITEKAGLTNEEAQQFFALYKEMRDKQKTYYNEIRKITFKTDITKTSEEEFHNLNNRLTQLNKESHRLEGQYIAKFRTVVSEKKLFLIRKAERQFQFRQLRKKAKP